MGVVGPGNCLDSYANGIAGEDGLENLFSIFDFSMESLEGNDLVGDWDINESHCLGPIPSNVLIEPLMNSGPVFLSSEPAVSTSEDPELKQVSDYIQDSSGSDILQEIDRLEVPESRFFQTQSPNSVLESSGSSSTQKTSQKSRRARSKRARAPVNPWLAISPFLSVATSASKNAKKEKQQRKKTMPPPNQQVAKENKSEIMHKVETDTVEVPEGAATKKCTHCEVTKTPQWREGPTGPKTLCNACGVRYRSGRLFPEYRPAASPTFVPALHSNSHKKVVEMRNKEKRVPPGKINAPPVPYASPPPPLPELSSCYLNNYI